MQQSNILKKSRYLKFFHHAKKILKQKALVFGYTLVEDEDHVFDHHELLFKTKQDLKKLVENDFDEVSCFQSLSETRHNLYFLAKNN